MPKYPNNDDLLIFQKLGVDELSRVIKEKSGGLVTYSPQYLLQIRSGYTPLSDEFKDRVAKVLGEPKESLFTPAEGSEEEGREQEAERR